MIYQELEKLVFPKIFFLDWIDMITFENIIGLFTFIILAITLIWVMKYTKATEKMKEEMVHQRIMGDAFDIEIRLQQVESYDLVNDAELNFAKLKVSFSKTNNICEFHLLDSDNNKMPRSNLFYKVCEQDDTMITSYYLSLEHRKEFIEMLIKNEGIFKAIVKTTSGNSFIYAYQAKTENYKTAKDFQNSSNAKGHGGDIFFLVKKEFKSS